MADSAPQVSVVVPVFNPGERIDACIDSLLHQSMPSERYEVILVDDGSTDGTGARLDELARRHINVRVRHIENSGWPGRPRNVGIDMAGGEYIYFVDNDDWIGEEALERLHALAVSDSADIVIGKVVGHGKSVPRPLFRRNRSGVTLEWEPLIWLLTPHKLWRRSFILDHDLRFPEGRRRLEDHVFVMRAYFQSPQISILADYPCYHWVLWDADSNASWGGLHSESYFTDMREVLDIIDENTVPGPARDRLHVRWYRGKVLNKIPKLAANPESARPTRVIEEMRSLANDRFGDGVDALLPYNLQLRSALLRSGDFAALSDLVRFESELRPQFDGVRTRVRAGRVKLAFECEMSGPVGGARFRRSESGTVWDPPASAVSGRSGLRLADASSSLEASTVLLLLRHQASNEEVRARAAVQQHLTTTADGSVTPHFRVRATVAARDDPHRQLRSGSWEVHVRVIVAGFRGQAALPMGNRAAMRLVVRDDGSIRCSRVGWKRRLQFRLPDRLVRSLVQSRRALRRLARTS